MNIEQIQKLDSEYYMNTFGSRFPVAFSSGKGTKLYSTDGKEYTDFLAGIAVNALGYNNEKFTESLCNQIKSVLHYSNYYYNESQVKLAQKLIENSDFDKVFFANSGTEANEGAVKLARKYHKIKNTGRYEVISANNSFHGRTLAMVAATGQKKYQDPYTPLPEGFIQVDYNDFDALKNAVNEKTAAVLLEVIQGEGGVIEAGMDYMKNIEKLCKDNDILLIIDEVQTGMGRTGMMFGYQNYGIQPDIITLAKALGNGVPIGAILARKEVSAFTPGDHGTTFGGNALACTAGLSVLEIIEEQGLLSKVNIIGSYFKNKLLELKKKHDSIVDVRGRGLILGLELKPELTGKDIVKTMLEKGFIINCAGHNTLRFVPPYIITEKEIDKMLAALSTLI